MGAIYVDTEINRATINHDECVECGTCLRGMSQEHLNPTLVRTVRKLAKVFLFRFEPEPDVCPTAAFTMNELEMPRLVRQVFSDPVVEHKSTGIKGRGTEEVKTNDVNPRVAVGEVGYTIEFGRPGVGVRFRDIQQMTRALAKLGVAFEDKNPISHLMSDKSKGTIREDILGEKILSGIVEIRSKLEQVEAVLDTVDDVNERIDTVMAVGISTRCDEQGEDKTLAPLLEELGFDYERAKTNMGLGANYQRSTQGGRMTNTLHRYGKAESFHDDYIIFCIPCAGRNDEGALEKQKQFLRLCAKHQPSNMGNGNRGSFKPERHLNPASHWSRDTKPDWEGVISEVKKAGTVAAVFDSKEKAEACLRDVIDADLGLSVNISTSVDGAKEVAECCGIKRHSGRVFTRVHRSA